MNTTTSTKKINSITLFCLNVQIQQKKLKIQKPEWAWKPLLSDPRHHHKYQYRPPEGAVAEEHRNVAPLKNLNKRMRTTS